jgi:adenosine deaminase
VELHLHIDGSLTADDVTLMAKEAGVDIPSSRKDLKSMLICPNHCKDLNRYLRCFDLPIALMQQESTIAYSVESLVRRLDAKRLLYAELRFAPQQHTKKGLTQEAVVKAAVKGLRQGLANCHNGFKANLILSCMRGDGNEELNMETVRLAGKYLGDGVCGTDLAGAEALYPTANFRSLFVYAKSLELPFTIHAGEAAGVESMRHAIEFGARRIGHGIRSYADAEMKQMLKDHDVCLTLCPSSNLQTKALQGVTSFSEYPLQAFFDDGVSVNLSSDNMTVSKTSLQTELENCFTSGIITPEQAKRTVESAISHSFLSEREKKELFSRCWFQN